VTEEGGSTDCERAEHLILAFAEQTGESSKRWWTDADAVCNLSPSRMRARLWACPALRLDDCVNDQFGKR
jgi:hypothetical protein